MSTSRVLALCIAGTALVFLVIGGVGAYFGAVITLPAEVPMQRLTDRCAEQGESAFCCAPALLSAGVAAEQAYAQLAHRLLNAVKNWGQVVLGLGILLSVLTYQLWRSLTEPLQPARAAGLNDQREPAGSGPRG